MKKYLILLLIVLIGFTAYVSKPDNKTCIIKTVEAIWGKRTPDKYTYPGYYEQFMNTTSKAVEIDNWIFFKRIKYEFADKKRTVGIGLFKQVVLF